MIKIMFVCLGNICRSPMAEAIMKSKLKMRGLDKAVSVSSAATSWEEEGNGMHKGAISILTEKGIEVPQHYAKTLTRFDYGNYNYFIGMEQYNLVCMKRIFGNDGETKCRRLLDYTSKPRDIADPYYTHNFELTYNDIDEGCEALLNVLERRLKRE